MGGGSSVRVDLDVDASDFADEINELVGEWPGHRDAVLLGISENLVGGLKREIPTNTGRAKGTVRALETGTDKREVVAGGEQGVDYIKDLLEGTSPHAPGPKDPAENRSLARWADRNNFRGGFYAIYSHIQQKGTKAHDFVSDPLARTQREAGGIAESILRGRGAFR